MIQQHEYKAHFINQYIGFIYYAEYHTMHLRRKCMFMYKLCLILVYTIDWYQYLEDVIAKIHYIA